MGQSIARLAITLCIGVASCTPVIEETGKNTFTDIILIMVDDMGYSDLGCFGGEIQTPNLDTLARQGLRLTRFYNNAKCYPSRASLLTGTYPHKAGLGRNILSLQKPKGETGPYQGWLGDQVVTIAEVLKGSGYKSYASGKWHVGEKPEDWPLQRGFDRYFGLVSGASSYFELLGNQRRVRQMVLENELWTPPDSGFYMTDAITDYAVDRIKDTSLDSGIFLYVAYTAPHWPLHAQEEDIAKYEGVYDVGWKEIRDRRFDRMKVMGIIPENTILSPKPTSIPDWDTVEKKSEWSRKMQVYAAMMDRVDQGVGRILDAVSQRGNRGNTLVIFLSDNGASRENIDHRKLHTDGIPIGLRGSYKSMEEPWANVSNTPFRRYKTELHEGGIRTPLIANWPTVIDPGQLNTNYLGHLMDFMPTILELTNTNYPSEFNDQKISSVDGKSLLPLFNGDTISGHEVLCWEYQENKVVLKGQWKLIHPKNEGWELYHILNDPTEQMNLAEDHPQVVKELKSLYDSWASDMGI